MRRDFSFNQFSSSIPSTIGQLTALTALYVVMLTVQCQTHVSGFARRGLSGNQLTGSIPSTIGQLTALTFLYVFMFHVDYYGVGTLASRFARRYLHENQLTDSIPSTIGQLTALRELYVFVLTIQRRSSRFSLRTQESFRQPVDKLDSVDDWTIDGTHFIVRVRVDYSVSELTFLASHAGLLPTTS
jgi:hypothetical protein